MFEEQNSSPREPGRAEGHACASKKRISRGRSHSALIFGVLAMTALTPAGRANTAISLPNMGMLTAFAVSGGDLNISKATVMGNVAVNNNGVLAIAAGSSLYGSAYLGQSATLEPGSDKWIKPAAGQSKTYKNPDLLYDDLYRVSSALASLDPFTPYASLTASRTIAGSGGVNVIQVLGDVHLSSQSITLTGGADDVFVINVLGGFDLSGSGGIVAGEGMDASRILINIVGSGTSAVTNANNVIDGTILLPNRGGQFQGVNGAIYGGTELVTVDSKATVTGVTFAPPPPSDIASAPEPGMILLTGGGLAALGLIARRQLNG